ncbi:MAG: DUF4065 domain-containing protein [Acidobacteriota bacterium]|nr:DUF4065 domain-containing protein [Acidobacteriota bacterium]
MAYPSLAIANYFIDRGASEKDFMDPLRIQKLVYIAHGWYLAVYGEPLLKEKVQAWKYGPVIPSLYRNFKVYGNGPILDPALDLESFDVTIPQVPEDDTKARAVLDRVWELYRPYSGVRLSNLTHQPDTPWHAIWSQRSDGKAKIPNDLIQNHFIQIAHERPRKAPAQ